MRQHNDRSDAPDRLLLREFHDDQRFWISAAKRGGIEVSIGLIALLDDVAAIAKVAAASLGLMMWSRRPRKQCRSSQQSEFHEDLLLENLVGLKRWHLIMPKRRELIPATLD